jgi:Ca2+-dependent lipid-binding protein
MFKTEYFLGPVAYPGSFLLATGELSESVGANGTVEVHVIAARGLRGVDKSGTSDPYVRLKVGKDSSNKTKRIKKSLDPEW